jgi:hypothetical protein
MNYEPSSSVLQNPNKMIADVALAVETTFHHCDLDIQPILLWIKVLILV